MVYVYVKSPLQVVIINPNIENMHTDQTRFTKSYIQKYKQDLIVINPKHLSLLVLITKSCDHQQKSNVSLKAL